MKNEMLKKHLVTTPLEYTWPKKNEKILFLGEWCKSYSKKDQWKNLDFEVLDYHWNDRNKFEKDYYYLIDYIHLRCLICQKMQRPYKLYHFVKEIF